MNGPDPDVLLQFVICFQWVLLILVSSRAAMRWEEKVEELEVRDLLPIDAVDPRLIEGRYAVSIEVTGPVSASCSRHVPSWHV